MSDQARIAEVLRRHRRVLNLDSGTSHCFAARSGQCDFAGGVRADWEAHVAPLIDAALRPRIDTVADLDALPRGSVVMTMSPRLIPGQVLWIRADDDADGHWWQIGSDDSFLSKDVLYGNPEYARVLWIPESSWQ